MSKNSQKKKKRKHILETVCIENNNIIFILVKTVIF